MAKKTAIDATPTDDDARSAVENFEKAMLELEAVVSEMESGELPLEASLKKFERGIALARQCQKALESAELRVQQLTGEGHNESLTDFDTEQ